MPNQNNVYDVIVFSGTSNEYIDETFNNLTDAKEFVAEYYTPTEQKEYNVLMTCNGSYDSMQ